MKTKSTVDGKTLADAYLRRIALSHGETAHLVKRDGAYHPVTWGEIHSQVLGIFKTYQEKGIQKGDRVCILSQTRSEWNIADLANLSLGVATVPIYQSNLPEDVAYILEHCEPKLVYAEDSAQVAKLDEAFRITKKKVPVVFFDPKTEKISGLDLTSFADFAKATTNDKLEKDFQKIALSFEAENTATIVYTSGTTGQPKGAVLTHANFLAELRAVIEGFDLSNEDLFLSFLPTAHILGRVESLMPVLAGVRIAYAENINLVAQNIQETSPTLLISVPRIYEKIFSKIQSDVASQPEFKQNLFNWAVSIGQEVATLKSEHKAIPIKLQVKFQIADRLVLGKVRAKMGGKIRMTVSGGAPLAQELCKFFHACGIMIMEGYGLTETTAAVAVNYPKDYSFGTVGKPLGETEFKIAADGEILTRSPVVFKEYYKNPTATQEVFTQDGFFCTGDIGEITERGFLKITDRKKELIVTSAGKNIAPQKLENLLKTQRFVSQAMVYGDKQKYLSVLLTLNEPEIQKWAKSEGVPFDSYKDLVQKEAVVELIGNSIKGINQHLASYETIKKFRILPQDFTVETGELTPSLKVKRKVVVKKFQNYIDEMYQ